MADCTPEEFEEFRTEATELLDEAEAKILCIDKGDSFSPCYDAVFRVFHSLKGASGFLGLNDLLEHMHQMEGQYQQLKTVGGMSKHQIGYFLRGVDAARKLLAGDKVVFNHEEFNSSAQVIESKPIEIAQPKIQESIKVPVVQKSGKQLAFIIAPDSQAKKMLENLLQEENFNVQCFSDAAMALALIESECPVLILLSPEKSTFTPKECLSYINENMPGIELVLLHTANNEEDFFHKSILGFVDLTGHPRIIKASLKTVVQLLRITRQLDQAVETLYRQLPDLSLVLQEAHKEELLKEIDTEFRALISEKRSRKVS